MSGINGERVQQNAAIQAAGFAIGVVTGAVTGNPHGPKLPNRAPQTAVEIGQAMGASAVNGAGVADTLAAGVKVPISKVRKVFGQS